MSLRSSLPDAIGCRRTASKIITQIGLLSLSTTILARQEDAEEVAEKSCVCPISYCIGPNTLFDICDMNSISLMQESVDIAAEWTNKMT